MKKYEFTGETKKSGIVGNITVRRIRATVAFGLVEIGELGGWIEKEENLSQKNNAWVFGDAEVYGNAWVCGDAEVYGNAKVFDDAIVFDNAKVCGDAWVHGNARISDNAEVYGNANVCDDAWVYGNAKVYGNAEVWNNANVYGNAKVYGDAHVHGNARISDNAEVYGNANVWGNANVCDDAEVLQKSHLLVVGPVGSRNDFTTFFRNKDNEITVRCGCFLDNINEFLKIVQKTHEDNKYALIYRKVAEIAKLQIEND